MSKGVVLWEGEKGGGGKVGKGPQGRLGEAGKGAPQERVFNCLHAPRLVLFCYLIFC